MTVPRLTTVSRFSAWIAVAAAIISAAPAMAAEPSITARPLEGDSIKGRLIDLGADVIKIAVGSDVRDLAPAKLMWIEFATPGVPPKPSIWLELVDGSRVSAVTYLAREGKATVGLATGQTIELPTRSIRTVRFQQQSPELALQWREITSSMEYCNCSSH